MGCTLRLSLRALILAVALTATIFTAFVFGGNETTPTPNMTPLDELALVGLGMSSKGGGAVEAPTQPMGVQLQEIGSLWMHETSISDVVVIGNYAFAVGTDPGFMVFDITNPSAPQRVLWLKNSASFSYGTAIEQYGSYLYLLGGTDPVQIFDVSNPLNPIQVGSYTPPDNGQPNHYVTAMAIHGQYLYLVVSYGQWTQRTGDLLVLNIANPAAPSLVGSAVGIGMAYMVAVEGDYAYVGRMDYYNITHDALVILDISNPANPHPVSELATGTVDSSGSFYEIAVVGQRAYVPVLNRGLMIVDISNPATPVMTAVLSDMYGNYRMHAEGNLLFVTKIAYTVAMTALDISNPDAPTSVGQYTATGYLGRMEYVDHRFYVASAEYGMKVIDVANPSAMTLTGQWSTDGAPSDLVVANGKAYVADGDYGLVILDVTNPTQIDTLGKCAIAGTPLDIELYGSVVYMATFDGLVAIDVSNPGAPVATWGTMADGDPQQLAITGHYLYSAAMYNGVYIYDLSNPQIPVRVRQFNTLGMSWGVVIEGTHAYVADHENGLLALDITVPTDPYIVGRVPAPQHDYESGFDKLVYVNGYVYAYATNDYMHIINMTDPSNPIDAIWYDNYQPYRMSVSGNRLFMIGSGLWILDVANPANPEVIGYRSDVTTGVVPVSGLMYVSGFPGLTVLSMSDYYCGDLDNSLALPDIGDLSFLVDYLFSSGPAPSNPSAGNMDGSGGIDIADLTVIVDYLFFGSGALNCF